MVFSIKRKGKHEKVREKSKCVLTIFFVIAKPWTLNTIISRMFSTSSSNWPLATEEVFIIILTIIINYFFLKKLSLFLPF